MATDAWVVDAGAIPAGAVREVASKEAGMRHISVFLVVVLLAAVAGWVGEASSVTTDKAQYAIGELITFSVQVDPSDLGYCSGMAYIRVEKPDGTYTITFFTLQICGWGAWATSKCATVTGQAGAPTGTRKVSLFCGTKKLAETQFTVGGSTGGGTFYTDKPQYAVGESITIHLQRPSGCSPTVVLLRPDGIPVTFEGAFGPVTGASSIYGTQVWNSFTGIVSAPTGVWTARLSCGSTVIAQTSFVVVAGTASIQPGVPYTIMAKHSGKVLDVKNGSKDNHANVWQWPYNGTDAQLWYFQPVGGGLYHIVNKGSGKCLDVDMNDKGFGTEGGKGNGSNVQQYGLILNKPNQLWRVESVGGEYYRIVNQYSGMVLDVRYALKDDGANVWQWTWSGGDCQQWRISTMQFPIGWVDPTPGTGQGTLQLTSTPSGVQVYIDGAYKGVTPLTVQLAAGAHTVTFRLAGYPDVTRTVTIQAGATHTAQAWFGP